MNQPSPMTYTDTRSSTSGRKTTSRKRRSKNNNIELKLYIFEKTKHFDVFELIN